MKKKNRGFTLIELLIVIGIIAILAAAVIIAINPGRQFEQARNATRWSHMNSIVNAIYSYTIAEGGTFPDCINDHEGDFVDASACDRPAEEGGLVPEYMSSIPRDPQIGEDGGCSGYIVQLDENRVIVKPYEDGDDAPVEDDGYVCDSVVNDDVEDLEVVQ